MHICSHDQVEWLQEPPSDDENRDWWTESFTAISHCRPHRRRACRLVKKLQGEAPSSGSDPKATPKTIEKIEGGPKKTETSDPVAQASDHGQTIAPRDGSDDRTISRIKLRKPLGEFALAVDEAIAAAKAQQPAATPKKIEKIEGGPKKTESDPSSGSDPKATPKKIEKIEGGVPKKTETSDPKATINPKP